MAVSRYPQDVSNSAAPSSRSVPPPLRSPIVPRLNAEQSYGTDNYTVYACYDFNATNLKASGTYRSVSSTSPTNITVSPNVNSLSFPFTSSVNKIQAGALLSFNSSTILARFGVSFKGSDQACANAEEEIPDWNWDAVEAASRTQWEGVLNRVSTDPSKQDANVLTLFYSSVSRASSAVNTIANPDLTLAAIPCISGTCQSDKREPILDLGLPFLRCAILVSFWQTQVLPVAILTGFYPKLMGHVPHSPPSPLHYISPRMGRDCQRLCRRLEKHWYALHHPHPLRSTNIHQDLSRNVVLIPRRTHIRTFSRTTQLIIYLT